MSHLPHPSPSLPPSPSSKRPRRTAQAAALVLLALLLTGCVVGTGSLPPLPPLQWARMPAQPESAPAARPAPAGSDVWQLVAPVPIPGHLDRDALLLPRGQAGLTPMAGVRWAEPLRDAVPRLLRDDLSGLLGAPVWQAPLPPGVRPTRQLRIELMALELRPEGDAVVARARWSIATPRDASAPPRVGEAATEVRVADAGPESVVRAHREALWRLAQAVAARTAD